MNAELQKQNEITLAYLEHEREQWLPWHQMDVRAGGMNGDAKARAAYFMNRIDRLLDELVIIEPAPEAAVCNSNGE